MLRTCFRSFSFDIPAPSRHNITSDRGRRLQAHFSPVDPYTSLFQQSPRFVAAVGDSCVDQETDQIGGSLHHPLLPLSWNFVLAELDVEVLLRTVTRFLAMQAVNQLAR